jgi:hypothetical protein
MMQSQSPNRAVGCPLLSLPPELHLHIISYLSESARWSLSYTNRHFQDLPFANNCFKEFVGPIEPRTILYQSEDTHDRQAFAKLFWRSNYIREGFLICPNCCWVKRWEEWDCPDDINTYEDAKKRYNEVEEGSNWSIGCSCEVCAYWSFAGHPADKMAMDQERERKGKPPMPGAFT